jgi:hypothetical protein
VWSGGAFELPPGFGLMYREMKDGLIGKIPDWIERVRNAKLQKRYRRLY